jgi:hypothetical protein
MMVLNQSILRELTEMTLLDLKGFLQLDIKKYIRLTINQGWIIWGVLFRNLSGVSNGKR